MRKRYVAVPCRIGRVSADYVVQEMHADGQTAQIKCYCYGEAVAQEIAEALTVLDAVRESLTRSSR
jgi:hypothetical protein